MATESMQFSSFSCFQSYKGIYSLKVLKDIFYALYINIELHNVFFNGFVFFTKRDFRIVLAA